MYFKVLREERVTGSVTTENIKASPNVDGLPGRISYENRGECFFLPFTKDEVEGNVNLVVGNKVSFQISTNNKYFFELMNKINSIAEMAKIFTNFLTNIYIRKKSGVEIRNRQSSLLFIDLNVQGH